jgi:hypothetical protein
VTVQTVARRFEAAPLQALAFHHPLRVTAPVANMRAIDACFRAGKSERWNSGQPGLRFALRVAR